jgi:hypothetical protein
MDEIEAPEAPVWYTAEEARAWQAGWETGRAAAAAQITRNIADDERAIASAEMRRSREAIDAKERW